MLSNIEHYSHYSLLEKLDDESGEWWSSYTCAITEDDDWDMEDAAVLVIAYLVEDAAVLVIAYLVESGCLTCEEVTKATQVLARCSEWDIGKETFIERVMKNADAVRGKNND